MSQRKHAARRLLEARAAYEREPDNIKASERYTRALERWRALDMNVKPSYLKGERL